jgi:hypothetical protein
MNLTQLATVETELQRKRYGQNKVLKLTGLKRRSRGHQEHLKRIKDGKVRECERRGERPAVRWLCKAGEGKGDDGDRRRP